MIQEVKQTNSKRKTDSHYRKIVATSGGEKEGRGKVGLKDTNYYVQDREATRVYCLAQGIIATIF